ncbi:Cytochrome c oxidase subunit 5C-2 [Artemisia annua]|uniref:Cytochrome c oxidase subunit 5C-2 n=1 Tax=Artemisia annua TaxID=35608 RepID=A0A2U1MF77_ARTAN|nr:Cytochrome c oxidase subunit 5C-2 [Artemisia annua]
MGGGRVAHPVLKGPSVVKELVIGAVLGLAAGGLWKMHHWNEQRKTRQFYDLLEKGLSQAQLYILYLQHAAARLSKSKQINASEKQLEEKKKTRMNSAAKQPLKKGTRMDLLESNHEFVDVLLAAEATHDSTPCTIKDAMNKDIPIIDISDDEQCKEVTRKRCRLINKGNFVNKKVIEIISSDDEKTNTTSVNQNQQKQIHHNETTV